MASLVATYTGFACWLVRLMGFGLAPNPQLRAWTHFLHPFILLAIMSLAADTNVGETSSRVLFALCAYHWLLRKQNSARLGLAAGIFKWWNLAHHHGALLLAADNGDFAAHPGFWILSWASHSVSQSMAWAKPPRAAKRALLLAYEAAWFASACARRRHGNAAFYAIVCFRNVNLPVHHARRGRRTIVRAKLAENALVAGALVLGALGVDWEAWVPAAW